MEGGRWIQTAKSAYVYGNKSDFANRSIYTREILRGGWIILKIFLHFFYISIIFFCYCMLREFEDVYIECVKNVYFLFFLIYYFNLNYFVLTL